MEGVISIRNSAGAGKLVPPVRLSEQEFVDCTKRVQANYDYFGVRRRKFNRRYGSYGCDGGWVRKAWRFSKRWGTMLNSDYPYTAVEARCKHSWDVEKIAAKAARRKRVRRRRALKWLKRGPMSIAVSAGNPVWRFYSSGTLSYADNCPTSLDHAVLLVGYAVEGETKVWKIQNSWGTLWGDQGFIKFKVERSGRGVCGMYRRM